MRSFWFYDRLPRVIPAIILPAIPFIAWDALVTGAHWHFNPEYVLGIYWFGLPLEEWLFFVTVPFACLFTWQMLLKFLPQRNIALPQSIHWIFAAILAAGLTFFYLGLQYTGLAISSFAAALLITRLSGSKLLADRRFYIFMAMVAVFTLIFNGYLTARPVVLYGEQYQLGVRIITIPLEDFFYGFALVILNVTIFEKLKSFHSARLHAAAAGGHS
jgi:lycopene cyclase domain-containing protein